MRGSNNTSGRLITPIPIEEEVEIATVTGIPIQQESNVVETSGKRRMIEK